MYISHCLYHCVFNIQMLFCSGGLQLRAAHTAVQLRLDKLFEMFNVVCVELLSSRLQVKLQNRKNSVQTKLPSRWRVKGSHTLKHMPVFAEEQVWLVLFQLLCTFIYIMADQAFPFLWVDIDVQQLQYSGRETTVCTLWHLCTGTLHSAFFFFCFVLCSEAYCSCCGEPLVCLAKKHYV